jgi:uncharacterized membrane protein (UPF0127 family)
MVVAGTAVLSVFSGVGAASVGRRNVLDGVVENAVRAKRPFRTWTEGRVKVGSTRLRIVIADDGNEQVQGLRERRNIGPYDAMLFAYDAPTATAFTMSTVPVPLDIGFYDARGRRVDKLRMEPCDGSDADCPLYSADGEFTYALETLAGDLPKGRLRPR